MNADEKQPLPKGWEWTTVGQIVEETLIGLDKGRGQQVPERSSGTYPYVKMNNVTMDGRVDLSDLVFVPVDSDVVKRYELRDGDILFNTRNSKKLVGKVGIIVCPQKGIVYNNNLMRIRVREGIDERFVCAQMTGPDFRRRMELVKKATTSVAAVYAKDLLPLPLVLPAYAKQKRIIAEIEKQFTRLDQAVASLKRAQANLQRYKASVLKAACEGRLVPQDPNDEPAEKLLERILAERRARWEEQEWQKLVIKAQKKVAQARRKAASRPARLSDLEAEEWQDLPEAEYARYLPKNDKWKEKYKEPEALDTADLPELPNGWVWATVEQLVSAKARSIQSGPFGSNLLHSEFQDSGILVIGIDNVLDMQFSTGSQHRISPNKYNELRRYTARPFDVLITVMATVGRCCVVPENLETAIISKHVYRISINIDFFNPHYLMFALSGGSEVRSQMFGKVRGQTRPGINGSILKKLAIPVPPLSEQQLIVTEIERHLSIISVNVKAIAADLARAERLRQSILQQAFSGQLVPQSRGRGGSRTAPTVTNTGNSA